MADEIDPTGAANVFASQMMALIALANALVESRVVKSDVLIASLESQMEKMRTSGVDAKFGVPLASLVRAVRREAQNPNNQIQ